MTTQSVRQHPKFVAIVSIVLLFSGPALAHHPLNGMPMQTFAHGLLSGLAHPILGLDHLMFLLAVGVVALRSNSALLAPAITLLGVMAGVCLNLYGVTIVANEILVALSVVVIGVLGMSGRVLASRQLASIFAGLGLFHGWAFGQAIAGQEAVASAYVVGGYLIGLLIIQYAIAVLLSPLLLRAISRVVAVPALRAPIACAVVTGAGLAIIFEQFESVLFAV